MSGLAIDVIKLEVKICLWKGGSAASAKAEFWTGLYTERSSKSTG